MAARDPRRSPPRLITAMLFVVIVACTSERGVGTHPPCRVSPSRASTPSAPGGDVATNSVRIEPPLDGSFLVGGSYPRVRSSCKDPDQPKLTARYPGTLTVERAADGTLSVTVTLSFERYLEGIAEVPPSWPREAL